MGTIALVCPSVAVSACLAIAADAFTSAAAHAARSGALHDDVVVVSADGRPGRGIGGRAIPVDASIADVDACDLLWVGASWGDPVRLLADNDALVRWIAARRAGGSAVVGIADAPFLLAAAGLLDGRSATVFPDLASELQRRFPAVDVCSQRPLVDACGVYTAAGFGSVCDLLVRLIASRYGGPTARFVQSWLLVDLRRDYDATRFAFDAQRDHGDAVVLRIQDWLESHYAEPEAIGETAARFAVSPRTLTRRFKAATGELPSVYLQRVRAEVARDLLRRTSLTVGDVMVRVGYHDHGAFIAAYRRHVGGLPSDERRSVA